MDLIAGTQGDAKVLVVEDDPVSAMLIRRLFVSQGIAVDHAPDGRVALMMHEEKGYRLLVSDWMMPEMDGVELCRAFRAKTGPYVYFILCSAKGQRADRLEAFEAGVDDFLSKPLDKDELLARLTVARRMLATEEALHAQKREIQRAAQNLQDMNLSLELASKRFAELFNGLPVGCFTFDDEGTIHEWNRGAEEVFGIKAHEAFQRPVWEVLDPGQDVWNEKRVSGVFAGKPQTGFDWTIRKSDGQVKYLACNLISLRSMGGKPVGAICANVDITQRKLAEQRAEEYACQLAAQKAALEEMNARLNHLAITDGLTGLSNHRRFQELLEEAVEEYRRTLEPFSLILLDIDHFKKFNDDFGHQTGDLVLKKFADALRQCARTYESPARYGGEEFAIILNRCDLDQSIVIAERFRQAIVDQKWSNREVTASLGVTTCESTFSTPKDLIAQSDQSLYASKQTGRNKVTHYHSLVTRAA